MKNDSIEEMVEKKLDQVSSLGEHLGLFLGRIGRSTSKALIGGLILMVFGLAAFIWALIHGLSKKK